jgi:hydroxymethylglutaryl-CoA synthase
MQLREMTHNARGYVPQSDVTVDSMFAGTYYLEEIDERFRRNYARMK